MCSISHELKCVYLHTPKCGGTYITEILEKFYNFDTYFFTSENHINYINEKILNKKNFDIKNGIFFIKKNMYQYFRNSTKFNLISGMDENKWKEYFKFTFKRHPFDKFISAYKYLNLHKKNISFIDILKKKKLNYFEYFHISITLTDLLINDDSNIEFNYIGEYSNLNEELIYILKNKLNINDIKHKNFILNNIIINSSDKNISNFNTNNDQITFDDLLLNENINEEFINLFNEKFSKDYLNFNYNKININNFKSFCFNKKKIVECNNSLIIKYNLIENKNNDLYKKKKCKYDYEFIINNINKLKNYKIN